MASIKAGTYTVQEILDAAGFDLEKEAAVDYGDGVDRRRVKVGGLGFDSVDETIHVPVTANELTISLDGEDSVTLNVSLDADQKKVRKASFETALDANDE